MDEQRTVTLWSADGLTVTARRGTGGNLVIEGQDLRAGPLTGSGFTEYEYGLTVAAADLPVVLAALQADPGADVLDVLAVAGPELVRQGESRWLAALGLEVELWSRSG